MPSMILTRNPSGILYSISDVGDHTLVELHGQRKSLLLDHNLDDFMISWKKWTNGELVQNAFPYLSSGEREFLMTGLTELEFDELFGNDDHE